ncbi:MAG: imidazole glycerol phosphate synthase subunit HisH [Chloroflexota bacterium]
MTDPTITIIDYGGSNLRSAQKAFEYVGAKVIVTADPDVVTRADKLVLPGVGAFKPGMGALRHQGLDEAARTAVASGTPLLGICLGMQFLFDISEEMGEHAGLGVIPGRVVRFEPPPADPAETAVLKVPHMGWNEIHHDGTHPLLAGVPEGGHGYFVHSYYCRPEQASDTVAQTDYGTDFTSVVGRDNVMGIQFHPEKSQSVGLRILRNFVTM